MRAHSFWAALEQARDLNLSQAGEAPAVPGRGGITRRRVLAAIGGLAGAAALPGWPAFAQPVRRVAIVGGGLAGLSALWRLRRAGVDATLYEARAAVGGRTRSVRGVFAPDYAFDEGGQLVNSDHRDMIALIGRLGLRTVDRRGFGAAREIQIGPQGRSVADAMLAQALRPIAARISADSRRLDADEAAVGPELDRLSVKDYLDRARLRPGAARDALEAAIRTEYGAEPEEASALELVFNLPTVNGTHVSRISTSDERYLISGGTAQVAQGLAAAVADRIRLGRRLVSIRFTPAEVRLGFADGEEVAVDRVILALPAPLYRELRIDGPLPELWRTAFREIALGRNEKLIVGFDQASWRRSLGFGGALWADQPFCAAWDAASVAPRGAAEPGAITFFLGGDQVTAMSGEEASAGARRFTRVARQVLPALAEPNGRVRRTRWCDDPLTRGSYINYRPGQLTRFAGLLTLEDEEEEGVVRPSRVGPLLFAGEWLSEAWPGYMNGAVQTGRIAADALLAEARAQAA